MRSVRWPVNESEQNIWLLLQTILPLKFAFARSMALTSFNMLPHTDLDFSFDFDFDSDFKSKFHMEIPIDLLTRKPLIKSAF